jgi:hypothetical protein
MIIAKDSPRRYEVLPKLPRRTPVMAKSSARPSFGESTVDIA